MPGLPEPSPDAAALVTGASSGIGTELARELARRGHGVILVARRRERLEEIAADLRESHGVRAEPLPCDLGDREARAALPGQVEALGLRVDVLVNNAGFATTGAYHRSDLDRELQQIHLLVEAVADLTHRFGGPMVERESGAILTVASTAGQQPMPRMAGYGAAKSWGRSFMHALHEELRHKGIAVTTLSPGPVETELWEHQDKTPVEALVPRALWQTPEQVARAGVDALAANKVEVIPGAAMRAFFTASGVLPEGLKVPAFSRAARARGA